MQVTKLEEVTKNRYKVYVDEQFAFVLYKGELSRYHLKLDDEVTEGIIKEIKEKVILKRAKKRVLYLLEQMARSESQIRNKMKQNFYPEDIVDEAISYAKSFGYINDMNYVRSFIRTKMGSKSKREIYALLLGKGIDKGDIETAIDEFFEENNEIDTIKNIALKKGYDKPTFTDKDREKLYGYLNRKGFSYSDICQVLRVSEWNA